VKMNIMVDLKKKKKKKKKNKKKKKKEEKDMRMTRIDALTFLF
jgi:hypothetical protein